MPEPMPGPADGPAVDMRRLRADMDRRRRQAGLSWNQLALRAGLAPSVFTRLNDGHTITLESFARVCSSLGLEPGDYMPGTRTDYKEHTMQEETYQTALAANDWHQPCRFTMGDVRLRRAQPVPEETRYRLIAVLPAGEGRAGDITLGAISAADGRPGAAAGYTWRLTDAPRLEGAHGRTGDEQQVRQALLDAIAAYWAADRFDGHDPEAMTNRVALRASLSDEHAASPGWWHTDARQAVKDAMDLVWAVNRAYAHDGRVHARINDGPAMARSNEGTRGVETIIETPGTTIVVSDNLLTGEGTGICGGNGSTAIDLYQGGEHTGGYWVSSAATGERGWSMVTGQIDRALAGDDPWARLPERPAPMPGIAQGVIAATGDPWTGLAAPPLPVPPMDGVQAATQVPQPGIGMAR